MAVKAHEAVRNGAIWRLMTACTLLMLMVTSFSGCIDVELAKELFVQEDQAAKVYVNKVYTFSYSFTTVIAEPETIEFAEVFDIPMFTSPTL